MNRTLYRVACAIAVVSGALIIAGCGSSDAAKIEPAQQQASATEMMQHDMAMERAKNDSLLVIVNRLERDNQAATARAVEAETELAEMKRMAASQAPAMKPQSKVPSGQGSYEEGLKLFHAHKFDEAAGQFESVLSSGSSPDLADNCHYWLGECSYGMKNYKEAIEHFNQVFTFKISEKKDDAQMMIANSYLAMGDKERAKAEFQKLIDKYPASTYVARAKEKLSRL
jgi:TolA-binding protein